MISERKNEYTTVVLAERKSDSLKITAIELDRLREEVRVDQERKLEKREDMRNTVSYTLGRLNLTEFLKNSFELPLIQEQRAATYFALTPYEDADYHRLYIFDNGPGIQVDFLNKDKERKSNGLAEYQNILGNFDTIDSLKGSSGRGLAQISQTFERLRKKQIIGSIKLGNIGGDDNPQGAMVVVEAKKTNNLNAASLAEKTFQDVVAEYCEILSPNVSCIPRANSQSSLFISLHLSRTSVSKSSGSTGKSLIKRFNPSPGTLAQPANIFEEKTLPLMHLMLPSPDSPLTSHSRSQDDGSSTHSEDKVFENAALKEIEVRIEELAVKITSCFFFSGLTQLENEELDFLLAIETRYKKNPKLSACIPAEKPQGLMQFQLYNLINQLEEKQPLRDFHQKTK